VKKSFLILILFGSLRFVSAQGQIVNQNNFNAAVALYNQAIEHFDFGEVDQALLKFDKAISLNPNNSDYFFGRASCHYDQKNYQKAAYDITQAINLEPNQPDYHYYAGNIFFKLQDYKKAIANYSKALETAPENPDININLTNVRYNRGVSALSLGQYTNARKDFEYVMNEDPEHADAVHNLAVALLKLGDRNQACSMFAKSEQLGVAKSKEYRSKYCK